MATIDSGLQVLAIREPAARSFTAALLARRGPSCDAPGKWGLAHLVEHLLLAGDLDGEPIGEPLEAIGGQVEGVTYRQHVRAEMRGPLAAAHCVLERLAGVWCRGPTLSGLDSERSAVILECQEMRTSAELWVTSLAWDAVTEEPSFRGFRPELFRDLSRLGAEDVTDWTRSLGTDGWVLSVLSPLPTETVVGLVTEVFNQANQAGVIAARRPHRPVGNRVVRLHHDPNAELASVGFALALAGPPDPADIASGRVLASLLTGGTRGLLFRELREGKRLVYDAISRCVFEGELLGLELFTCVPPHRSAELVTTVQESLELLAGGSLQEGDLRRAKAFTNGVFELSLENPANVGRWVSNRYMSLGELVTPGRWSALVEAVTADDVSSFAQRALSLGDCAWALSGPRPQQVERAFADGWRVEEVTW